jgi:hypothetical protein
MYSSCLRDSLRSMKIAPMVVAAATALVLGALAAHPALAHTRAEIGPYVLILGWENEPVIVGERNALLIEITQDGVPVEGLEGTIDLTVFYAGRSFIGLLAPTDEAGIYKTEIFPTQRGQYEVQLRGQIGAETFDLILEPEEVLPGDVLQFPEAQPAPVELQSEIDDLQAALASARNVAYAGLGVGLIGLLLAVFTLVRSGRSS